MTLTLHHADELEPLLERLAEVLVSPLDDPFTPDLVVVPTAGVRDAVTAHLGTRLGVSDRGADGITANVDLVYMGRFMSRALGLDTHGDDPEPDPWHISRLTWTVLDVLGDDVVAVPVDDISWSFARRLADLFDRYSTQRPQLVQAWARGLAVDAAYGSDELTSPLSADHRWQYDLWREVRRRIDRPSLAERLPTLLDGLRSGQIDPDLPPRLAVVGFGSLAPAQWQLLQAVSAVRDTHVMLRTPSRHVWSDGTVDLGGRLVSARPGSGDLIDVAQGRRHPLLVSWGRRALEARAFLGGTPDVVVHAIDRPLPDPSSILQTVQADIRLDREPAAWSGAHDADRSVQVHACHGEVRQLEVLRDALGHAFVDLSDLQPHEVVVLCPDLQRFAPLIDAVFTRGDMPIPVRVGDRSLSVDDPVAASLLAALQVASGRFALSDVLGLVQRAPIRRRFGWSPSDVETITDWALDLGVRWGLSPAHREHWGLDRPEHTGTWGLAVRRLLAGIVQATPSPRLGLDDIPPFDRFTSDSIDLVGGLAEFIGRLSHLHETLAEQRTVGEWVTLLHTTLDELCADDPDEPWGRAALHDVLESIAASAVTVRSDTPVESSYLLSHHEILRVLDDAFDDRAGRLQLRSGAVTVTSVLPLHGVPARVVCLLGLDEGSLPSGAFDGDDILGLSPCIGERNPRHDSRQMLLDTLLAARERLIITCNGADLTTNEPLPVVVPVAELLDVVAVTSGRRPGDTLPVVARHPRHGFDERVLTTRPEPPLWGALDRPFTFDPTMREAAEARREAARHDPPDPNTRWWLPSRTGGRPDDGATDRADAHEVVADHETVPEIGDEHEPDLARGLESEFDVRDLLAAVKDPAAQLLRERLGTARRPRAELIDDQHGLTVGKLESATLGRELFAGAVGAARATTSGGFDQEWSDALRNWRAVARFDAEVPLGRIGDASLDEIERGVVSIVDTVRTLGLPLAGDDRREVSIALEIPGLVGVSTVAQESAPRSVAVRLSGLVTDLDLGRNLVLDIAPSKMKPERRLVAALKLALVTLAEPATPWTAIVVGLNTARTAREIVHLSLAADPADQATSARSLVALAVQMAWWSRRDAVPFFGLESNRLPQDLKDAIKYDDAAVLWGEWDVADLREQPVLGHDPTLLPAAPSRLAAVADWVWSTYRSSITESDPTKTGRTSS